MSRTVVSPSVSPGVAVELLDELVAAGLLERGPAADGGPSEYRITDKGAVAYHLLRAAVLR